MHAVHMPAPASRDSMHTHTCLHCITTAGVGPVHGACYTGKVRLTHDRAAVQIRSTSHQDPPAPSCFPFEDDFWTTPGFTPGALWQSYLAVRANASGPHMDRRRLLAGRRCRYRRAPAAGAGTESIDAHSGPARAHPEPARSAPPPTPRTRAGHVPPWPPARASSGLTGIIGGPCPWAPGPLGARCAKRQRPWLGRGAVQIFWKFG